MLVAVCISDFVESSFLILSVFLGESCRRCGLCRCLEQRGRFNWWNWMFRSRLRDRCESKCKLAAFAIAMNTLRKVHARAFSTRASQGMKSRELSTLLAPASLDGKSGNEWESGGTADIAATATPAAVVIS